MTSYADFILDTLRPWRPVTAKRMFGGQGIYHAGVMFALIADGQLFLKVDDESQPAFEAAGLVPFVYEAKAAAGGVVVLQGARRHARRARCSPRVGRAGLAGCIKKNSKRE